MSEIKLLPCPFCGGEASELKYFPHNARRIKTRIYCKNCRVNSGDWGRKDFAIKAWNTRKPMEQIVERLEEYREENKHEENSGFIDCCIDIVRAGGKE